MTVLREYQKRICRLVAWHFESQLSYKPCLVVMPTGAGKTQVFSSIAHWVTLLDPGYEVLVLAHRQELVEQAERRLKSVITDLRIGVWCGGLGRKERAPVMVGTIQSMREMGKWPKLIIIDECFPAGTLVSGRPIEKITCGDVVLSYNHGQNAWERKRVLRLFKSKPQAMVTVHLSDGRSVPCTAGHPFYTRRGYVPAAELSDKDEVMNAKDMRALRPAVQDAQIGSQVLRTELQLEAHTSSAAYQGRSALTVANSTGGASSANGRRQPDEGPGGKGKGVIEITGDRAQATHQGRKRDGTNDGPGETGGSAGMANRGCGNNGEWLSTAPLQAGHRVNGENGGNRGGWRQPSIFKSTEGGQTQGDVSSWTRVDRVEIHEQTGDGTFGGLCPDGYVYNIEVDGNHNYVVNGALVHNCHNLNDEDEGMYRDLLREAPTGTWVLGVTATPFRLSGGPIHGGPEKYFPYVNGRVTMQELIEQGFLVKPRLCGAPDILVPDVSEVKTRGGEYVTSDLARLLTNDLTGLQVDGSLARLGGRNHVVWFCLTIDHAETVSRLLQEKGETACVVHSKMTGSERQAALQGYEVGLFRHIVNVAVLTEGWDSPQTDAIVMLRPTISPVFYVQAVGRGLRPYPGKTDCLVLDYGSIVERLGPVDNPYLNPKKRGDGTGDAPLKICEGCFEYLPTSVRDCPECGYAFPAPKGNLKAKAAEGEMLGGGDDTQVVNVTRVGAYEHVSKNGNHCIKIEYTTGGWSSHSEYLMFDRDFQAKAALKCLEDLGVDKADLKGVEDVPSAMAAIDAIGGLFCPFSITIKRDGKYWRILKRSMEWPKDPPPPPAPINYPQTVPFARSLNT